MLEIVVDSSSPLTAIIFEGANAFKLETLLGLRSNGGSGTELDLPFSDIEVGDDRLLDDTKLNSSTGMSKLVSFHEFFLSFGPVITVVFITFACRPTSFLTPCNLQQ